MTYDQAPESVWAALTTRDAIALWLMPNDFELRIGHRFQFKTKPAPGFDGIVRCEVLEIEPLKKLVYSWVGGGVNTQVTWTLTPVGTGTSQTGSRGVQRAARTFRQQYFGQGLALEDIAFESTGIVGTLERHRTHSGHAGSRLPPELVAYPRGLS